MTSYGETKDKILKLIAEGCDSLSSISDALDLAPSTVSKHLHDLEDSGLIAQKDSSRTKKWKYYKLVNASESQNGSSPFARRP